jgi:hypothetical protein
MSNAQDFPQPFIQPYWTTSVDITNKIIHEYLVVMKPRGEQNIRYGYIFRGDDDSIDVWTEEENAETQLNALDFDYYDIVDVFTHAHYIAHTLGINGVRVVTGAGGCNSDQDIVKYFYAHQNIGFNPRGYYIMIPKSQAKKITRRLLRTMNK